MQLIASIAALAMAGALLSLQIVAGLEHTTGGTLYTQLSMVAAMATLAVLPIFVEVARRHGAYWIGLALMVAFIAFLAYSLPATVGRTGETKAAAAAVSVDKGLIERDLKSTITRLEWARGDYAKECATGAGAACRGKAQTVSALEARFEKLRGELKTSPAGDIGSETWAWASMGTVSAETIRRGSVLAFALGLDVAIWSLVWLATSLLSKPATVSATVSRASDLMLPKDVTAEDLENLRKLLTRTGRPVNNNEVARLMSVTKGEASKRVSAAVAAGLVQRRRVGREVSIASLH